MPPLADRLPPATLEGLTALGRWHRPRRARAKGGKEGARTRRRTKQAREATP